MNIFALDHSPILAAQMHCDKHVVKMILESAQLLSTAHRILDGQLIVHGKKKIYVLDNVENDELFYKTTHQNHPSAIWCRQTEGNYVWLHQLLRKLCHEYSYRYDKIHKCERIGLVAALEQIPTNINAGALQPFAMAMPDDCKGPDPVQAYRNYYMRYKKDIATWNKARPAPNWFKP